jgi:hypothetical protein
MCQLAASAHRHDGAVADAAVVTLEDRHAIRGAYVNVSACDQRHESAARNTVQPGPG